MSLIQDLRNARYTPTSTVLEIREEQSPVYMGIDNQPHEISFFRVKNGFDVTNEVVCYINRTLADNPSKRLCFHFKELVKGSEYTIVRCGFSSH